MAGFSWPLPEGIDNAALKGPLVPIQLPSRVPGPIRTGNTSIASFSEGGTETGQSAFALPNLEIANQETCRPRILRLYLSGVINTVGEVRPDRNALLR